ncbi:MAG: nitrous oxide reductase family maturation protein NosD [Peptococcaceae bacterium]|nr:nitrous oxide reductase family maturation protein NosD [Peptococcaceae bacterium]
MGQKILLCCFTVIFLAAVRCGPLLAATYDILPEEGAGSLGHALESAEDGDSIIVHGGHYLGNVVLDKAVSLIGLDNPILDGGGKGDVLTVLVDSVTIQGFIVQGSGRSLEQANAGIRLKSARQALISDCQIMDNLFGIYLDRSSGNTIADNEIRGLWYERDTETSGHASDGTGDSHFFKGEIGDGIHLFAASENILNNNTISQTRDGIYFNYAHANQTMGNQISEVRYGIHFMYSDDNLFHGNMLTNNTAGAALMFSKRIRLENNVFAYSRGFRAYGLLFATCDYSVAEGNILMDNTRGIFFDTSRHNVFRGNLFYRNDVGLDLISSASHNLFIQNNFIDNLQQVAMPAGRVGDDNLFYEEGCGNYWDDYRGFDLDRDGVGDIAHKTGDPFTFLMARSPAVRLFLNSPAAAALEFSERMFPVVNLPKVEDPYPLTDPVKMEALEAVFSQNPAMARVGSERFADKRPLAGCSFLMLITAFAIYMWASSVRCNRVFKRISDFVKERVGTNG